MVGDQRGQGLVTAEMAGERRDGEPQGRTRLKRGLLHVTAGQQRAALKNGEHDDDGQDREGQGMAKFHRMAAPLRPPSYR